MRLLSGVGSCWYLPTNIQWTVEVNQFIWPRLGTADYDWKSVLRRIFFRPAKRDGSYYCSEFVGEVLMRGGFPITEHAFSDPGAMVHDVLRFGPGHIYWLAMIEKTNPEPVAALDQHQPQAAYQDGALGSDPGY